MNEEEAHELAIRILDEFEELLADKGIKVPSEDREGRDEEACFTAASIMSWRMRLWGFWWTRRRRKLPRAMGAAPPVI